MEKLYERKTIVWQVQEAKAMFSEVIKATAKEPQFITVRGKETAVILSFEEYQRLAAPKKTLYEFIQDSPLRDFELDLEPRIVEEPREIEF